jgi:hypothetical protein
MVLFGLFFFPSNRVGDGKHERRKPNLEEWKRSLLEEATLLIIYTCQMATEREISSVEKAK